ncbi:carbohydrate-binding protein [Aquimarina agarilytica]|uniref:carbohydrate-binding protein n=1 Tax=Aquimarina agarilytica TaxID=1087449 RepID=UPI0002890429|nr:carbohydrate-binding protein [Aquimarina agarilytica]
MLGIKQILLTLCCLFFGIQSWAQIRLGNNSNTNGIPDGWKSNLIINLSDKYTNNSNQQEELTIQNFSFYARQKADPITPFVGILFFDANRIQVLSIGTTRYSSAYNVGQNTFPFANGKAKKIYLNPGETVVTGFLDARSDGSGGNIGAVIPFDRSGNTDNIWYVGEPTGNQSGSIKLFHRIKYTDGQQLNLKRNYHYNITFKVAPAIVPQVSLIQWFSEETIAMAPGEEALMSITLFPFEGADISRSYTTSNSKAVKFTTDNGHYQIVKYINDTPITVTGASIANPEMAFTTTITPVKRKPVYSNSVPSDNMISASNFDYGNKGTSFYDTNTLSANQVERKAVGTRQRTSPSGGLDVTDIKNGEWLEYTLDFKEDGKYNMELTYSGTNGGLVTIYNQTTGTTSNRTLLPNTVSNQEYSSKSISIGTANKGKNILRVYFDRGQFHFSGFKIEKEITETVELSDFSPYIIKQNIQEAGWYNLTLKLAAPSGGGLFVDIPNKIGGGTSSSFTLPETNSPSDFQTVSFPIGNLPKGENEFRLFYDGTSCLLGEYKIERIPTQNKSTRLGNTSSAGGTSDSWDSNLVVNTSDNYINNTGMQEKIEIKDFSFYAQKKGDPITPFVGLYYGGDNILVLSIGTTRTSSEYRIGKNTFPFKDGGETVYLNSEISFLRNGDIDFLGSQIVTGFLDALPNGSGGGNGSVIPYDTKGSTDQILYIGSPSSEESAVIYPYREIKHTSEIITQLKRNYHYNISFDIQTNTIMQLSHLKYANDDSSNDPNRIIHAYEGEEGQFDIVPRPLDLNKNGKVIYASSEPNRLQFNSNVGHYKVLNYGDGSPIAVRAFAESNPDIFVTELVYPIPANAPSLPGTVEAEDFNEGANGKTYFDKTPGNTGKKYRTNSDVDIFDCSEGGYSVGWMDKGEWLNYTVFVSEKGTYNANVRYSTTRNRGAIRIEFDGVNKTNTLTLTNTGSPNTYKTVTSKEFSLDSGIYTVRIYVEDFGININKVDFLLEGTSGQKLFNVVTTENLDLGIKIYPNPAKEFIIIEGGTFNKAYRILNLNGKVIKKGILEKTNSINCESIPRGMYLLEFRNVENQEIIQIEKVMFE